MKLKNIVLDLDNTLISTVSITQLNSLLENDDKVPLQFIKYDVNPEMIIFIRPHLQEFLDYIFDNYNVGIFTAGESYYAYHVIQNVILDNKTNRTIDFIMTNPHYENCFHRYGHFKYMDYITSKVPNYTKNNTKIIDDSVLVFDSNRNNTIKAEPFDVIIRNKTNIILNKSSYTDDYLIRLKNNLRNE
jgi:hypothetical protein